MYMRGFDRRGCTAAITAASATGFKVSGVFSDLADFVVLMLFDADDLFGHLYTTKFLPDFDLTGMVVDFDLAVVNGMNPGSMKFPSVPWGSLSWIKANGTSGTTPLNITATTGQVAASRTYTVIGSPVAFDRVQLIYLGNTVFDYSVSGGDTTTTVATAIKNQINALTGSSMPLSATSSGADFTVTCTQPGTDGNTIELLEMHKTASTQISPNGPSKLTGGVDPTSIHVTLDFSTMTLTSLRQCWLTLAPPLAIDTGVSPNPNQTLIPFAPINFSYTFTNWVITDPSSHKALKVAGLSSTLVDSRDTWAVYAGTGWTLAAGFYHAGFAQYSATANDQITITYHNQNTHDLYLGTSLFTDRGIFSVTLDGSSLADLDTYVNTGSAIQTRRVLTTAVAAGKHTLVLKVKSTHNGSSSGYNCYFDYLQAVVTSDVLDPANVYSTVGTAFDFDTDQTYKLPPQRSQWICRRAGFTGDLNLYAGVFFALKRVRFGGSFHAATVTLAGAFSSGNGFGSGGDHVTTVIGGTSMAVTVYPADTLLTMAQRFVDAINALFVGVYAAPTATAGQFTVTTTSPINGFTFAISYTSSTSAWNSGTTYAVGDWATAGGHLYQSLLVSNLNNAPASSPTWWLDFGLLGTMVKTGDTDIGNEGTWQVDAAQTSPLNQAFQDFLVNFCAELAANSMTGTVAWSQELLNPPDTNTSGGAWIQRFADATSVLTATGFGSWGTGKVEAYSAPSVTQTGHGYITGNLVHIASHTGSGVWSITVTGVNGYNLTTQVSNSGGYVPAAGDDVFIELQTSQCCFNPATVTAYLINVYKQTAGIMNGTGLTPWLQFGEVGWWFFSEHMATVIVAFSNSSGLIEVQTAAAHGLATGQTVVLAGTHIIDGTKTVTVIDSTHFTVDSSTWPGGSPVVAGTVSGGGMAYYDAYTAATAATALSRAMAPFYCQDDDPTIHSSADANFLVAQIKTHVDAVIAAVLGVYAGAKFEVLWPYDVNFATCYYSNDLPYPQGGRLNRAVNLPSAWHVKAGSGLDRFKVEGLSWGSFYRHYDNAEATVSFPYTTIGWSKADTVCLVPWFNGGCDWPREWLFTVNSSVPKMSFWAFDHLVLLSWSTQPLPVVAAWVHVF